MNKSDGDWLDQQCRRWGTSLALCLLATTTQAQGEPPAAASINACALLTPQEIRSSVALDVAPGKRNDEGRVNQGAYSSSCVWEIQYSEAPPLDLSAPLGERHFIILNAIRWPAGQGLAKSYLEAFRSAAREGEIPHQPTVRDLGDDALWWGDGVAARKDDVSFGISVFISGTRPQLGSKLEEQLVTRILLKLSTLNIVTKPAGE